MSEIRQFILLPRDGLIATNESAMSLFASMPIASSLNEPQRASLSGDGSGGMNIIDTIREDGPKLIEMDDEDAERIANAPDSPVRAVPIVTYDPPDPELQVAGEILTPTSSLTTVTFTCTDSTTGAPLADTRIVAFTDFSTRRGGAGTTDASGSVSVQLTSGTIERLYAYAPPGYWGAFRSNLQTDAAISIDIEPVDLSYTDAVRRYYGATSFDSSRNVTVGVLDTGVGPHGDLNIVAGANTVTGEPSANYQDPRGHGTHVAGLIGSNGAPPTGLRGVSPGVRIGAYRVFPASGGATNYAILKAMIRAASDGCDIVNLSLGGGPYDQIVQEAIEDARQQGMLVVVASGNDGRKPISYPAAYQGATAVSAMGHVDTFPVGSLPEGDVERPPHSAVDSKEFLASFSNVGPQTALTGLGVGVLSTLPGNQFGPMSGTSMAAPVVAGAAASLLSQDPTILAMPRDRARSDAIERLLQSNGVRRGFGNISEGYGLPDPNAV